MADGAYHGVKTDIGAKSLPQDAESAELSK